jgi:hypothetical protein
MENEVKALHPAKAQHPIEVTELGTFKDFKREQPQKAESPIETTL